MKKLFILLMCLGMGAVLLAGCSSPDADFRAQSYTAGAAQVQAIQIDVQDRKIEIASATDGQVRIDYAVSDREGYDIALQEDGTLVMTSRNTKAWTDYIGKSASLQNRTIRLYLPDGLLSSLEVATTNEDVSLPALRLRTRISVHVNNGTITFQSLDVGEYIELETKNGDIRGSITGPAEAFTITSTIKKGDSNLPEQPGTGAKTLSVTVNNGDIDINFVP